MIRVVIATHWEREIKRNLVFAIAQRTREGKSEQIKETGRTGEEERKIIITVQLSKFLIRQLSEATRPASAVTFLDASAMNCGPRDDELPIDDLLLLLLLIPWSTYDSTYGD